MAFDDDLIRKNPFEFELVTVLVNDSVRREAVSREVERKFLKFVNEDTHFSRYYEGIYILFKTGMRMSEFCGLTIKDIDLERRIVNIDHQLQRISMDYIVEETKAEAGKRKIPIKSPKRLAKYGISEQKGVVEINDKNSIRLPRQDLNRLKEMAETSYFWARKYLIYTPFTPFEGGLPDE